MVIKKLLTVATMLVAGALGINAQNWTASEAAEGTYYLYNVGAGKFLTSGNWWGTHAAVDTDGMAVTLAGSDNVYTISTTVAFSGKYLGDNAYMDNGTAAQWTFTEVNAEKNYYTMKNGDNYFVYVDGANADLTTTEPTDNNGYWQLVTKEQLIANLDYATKSAPIEASFYMTNPKVRRNWSKAIEGDGLNDNGTFNDNVAGLYEGGCTSYGQWHKQFDNYQNLTVKNGVYKVSVKGFYRVDAEPYTAVPYLYANESKGDLKLKSNPLLSYNGTELADNATDATRALVDDTYLIDPIEVTVTDGNLRVGVKSDAQCGWSTFREFTIMYVGNILKDATPLVSGSEIAADKWYSFEVANETEYTISAGTDLSAIDYIINDGTMLVEDANAEETSSFTSIQTLAAGTYYIKSSSAQTLTFTPNVLPTSVTLSEESVALNLESNTVEITATVGEAGAPQDVVWTTTNENVATVANGVITGVTPGTATIRATATGYETVYDEVIVTVSYNETALQNETTNEGFSTITKTYGNNIIKNGTFEYANGFYGWINAAGGQMTSSNFEIVTEGENNYLKSKGHQGSGGAASIGTGWAIESGKTYEFGYKVKSTQAGNSEYHKVSLTNTLGTETKQISDNNTPVTTAWTEVKYRFTNTDGYAYLQFRARWLGESGNYASFDDFYLAEVETNEVGYVGYIAENVPTVNVGTKAFQYSQDAINKALDDANALTQGTATPEDIEAIYNEMITLNAPESGKLYSIINNSDGYNHKGKAVTFKSASDADLAGNTTAMGYSELPGSAYPQGITFTAVPEVLNGYIISYTREDGNTVYVGTGASTGLGQNNDQIRPTTDPAKAVTIQIVPTATEGIWNLKNILANKNIGANGANDQGFYTKNTYTSMTLAEVTPLTVTVSNDAAESKFKTLILPFDAELPEGVTVYSCEEVVNSVLNTVAAPSIEANTPYILSVEAGKSVEFTGVGGAYTDASYKAGYLTGGYTSGTVPTGSYVLQTQEGVQGFYKVAETAVDYAPYRAYLTVPAAAGAKAFFFGGDATAINGVEGAEGATEVVRYNAAGVMVSAPVKGLNIVKMSDGTVKKVMVK